MDIYSSMNFSVSTLSNFSLRPQPAATPLLPHPRDYFSPSNLTVGSSALSGLMSPVTSSLTYLPPILPCHQTCDIPTRPTRLWSSHSCPFHIEHGSWPWQNWHLSLLIPISPLPAPPPQPSHTPTWAVTSHTRHISPYRKDPDLCTLAISLSPSYHLPGDLAQT